MPCRLPSASPGVGSYGEGTDSEESEGAWFGRDKRNPTHVLQVA